MRIVPALSLSCCLALTGCVIAPITSTSDSSGVVLQGKVHGGQQPISGAHVYLLAANTTGYGNASISLLTASAGHNDAIGNYVLTAADGSFSISSDYACTPNAQVYLYALGGNPGARTNAAAGLLAALGNCPSTGSFASSIPYIWINEVTTIAAAYSISGFATDATHISSSGTALAQTGIANAFANASNLASISSGVALTTAPTSPGSIVPQAEIDTLANILASCVNSSGSSSSTCTTLFTNATSGGVSPVTPTDTATAAINIAHNPGSNTAALYAMPAPAVAFAPALTAQPNDFTIGLTLSYDISSATNIAIDSTGAVWVPNSSSNAIVKFASNGSYVTSYSTLNLNQQNPFDLAIDLTGNVWVTSQTSKSITQFSSSALPLSPSPGYHFSSSSSTLLTPYDIAIDANNNVWVSDYGSQDVFQISNSGTQLFESVGGNVNYPSGIAVDSASQVWVANYNSTGVTAFSATTDALISGANGYQPSNLSRSYAVAIDSGGYAWLASYSNATLIQLNNSGVQIGTGFTGGGLRFPVSVAIDGAGNVWLGNSGTSVSEFTQTGVALSPSTGFRTSNPIAASCVAIDGSGDVWIANAGVYQYLTEFIGAAVPVVTPLVAGAKNHTLGTRP